jgi:hypothetical protein
LEFWGTGSLPFVSQYQGLLGAPSPTYVSFEWEHVYAAWLQQEGFEPTQNNAGENVYLLNLTFITAYNRSANAWDPENQVQDSFTLEISATLPTVTDPADCIYPGSLELSFYGDQQIFYYVVKDESRGTGENYDPSSSANYFQYGYTIKNLDLVQDICQNLFVEVSLADKDGIYHNLTDLANNMTVKYGITPAPIRIEFES